MYSLILICVAPCLRRRVHARGVLHARARRGVLLLRHWRLILDEPLPSSTSGPRCRTTSLSSPRPRTKFCYTIVWASHKRFYAETWLMRPWALAEIAALIYLDGHDPTEIRAQLDASGPVRRASSGRPATSDAPRVVAPLAQLLDDLNKPHKVVLRAWRRHHQLPDSPAGTLPAHASFLLHRPRTHVRRARLHPRRRVPRFGRGVLDASDPLESLAWVPRGRSSRYRYTRRTLNCLLAHTRCSCRRYVQGARESRDLLISGRPPRPPYLPLRRLR
ncbi:hypothetical protein C8J57DRAFT_712092 [Mycena rebaudengoi]|nr:hypothetical protein C8J57DRAFT_712092 [Mycena rebaudengoi]